MSGDATTAVLVAHSEGQLGPPDLSGAHDRLRARVPASPAA